MLTIAVCDDEEKERNNAQAMVKLYLQNHPELDGSITLFEDGSSLLGKVEGGQKFDIYILDILMPKMSGIDLGNALRKHGDRGQILYLTSSRDYAIESYDTGALNYLMKPVTQIRLAEVLDQAVANLQKQLSAAIMVNTQAGIYRVLFDRILYVEQSERAMHFQLSDGTVVTSCVLREPFASAVQPLLTDPRFMLCGSSFAVNLHRITSIGKEQAVFSTGDIISLPRTLQRDVKRKWMEYWLKADGQPQ